VTGMSGAASGVASREGRLPATRDQGRRQRARPAAGGQVRRHGGMGGLARQPSHRDRRGIARREAGR
jgi:hypothetical protein